MSDNKGGRPLKFQSVEEMQEAILNYFAECDKNDIPYTVTGLALALDTSRKVLIEYQGKDEFSNTIKRAKLMCENYAERHLFVGKSGVTGAIFSLKNNYGWVDQQVIKNESSIDNLSDEDRAKRLQELKDKLGR
ncbi:terminase small subunit [Neobacillus cucumis]|uniref:terminase small subunit n=1 Tax=Neobacillus cucumis TaxID=1740721 RepID=UPI002E237459|nr:terminase small subunit [Neobacillus cucumis]